MAQVLCLAVSRKHRQFCVAGIDLKNRRWIRPVSKRYDGAVSEDVMSLSGGKIPCLLDILEIPLANRQTTGEFQPENCYLQNKPWKKIGKANVDSLSRYAELSQTLLHNHADRVSPKELMALPKILRHSLQLIECTDATFIRDNKNAWRADFSYFGKTYNLRVTDPVVENALSDGRNIGPRCFLTVSLTEPWRCSSDMEPFCYKLVAGIIPQHHSIFTSSLEAFSPSVSHAEFLSAILVGPSPFCISG